MSSTEYVCRICLEEDNLENLISPCKCNGTIKYIHKDCLDKWRTVSKSKFHCTLCDEEYNVPYHVVVPIEIEESTSPTPQTEYDACIREFVCYFAILFMLAFCFLDLYSAQYLFIGTSNRTTYHLVFYFLNIIGVMVTTGFCTVYIIREKRCLYPFMLYFMSASTFFVVPVFVITFAIVLVTIALCCDAYLRYVRFILNQMPRAHPLNSVQ